MRYNQHPMTTKSEGTKLSRRAFSGGVLAAAMGGLAARVGEAAGASPQPAGKYVDIHVHLAQSWAKLPGLTVEQLLGWMDANQVAQAVILPLISPEAWYYSISTDWVLEQTKAHRDRFIPFCDIDPRTEYVKGKQIPPLIERYVEAGAKGLGEHKCGGPIDAPRNLEIFRVCSDMKLPVMLHMDTIRNIDGPGLPGLEHVLKECPDAKFIGHATTWWSSISGVADEKQLRGYPKGKVAPGGAIDRLMDKYGNIYGDLSAGSGLNALCRDRDFGREFLVRRADRLLFGTDYLSDGQKVDQFTALNEFDLPPAVQAKIFRDNSRRILGLS